MGEITKVKGKYIRKRHEYSAVCPYCGHLNISAEESDLCLHFECIDSNMNWLFNAEAEGESHEPCI